MLLIAKCSQINNKTVNWFYENCSAQKSKGNEYIVGHIVEVIPLEIVPFSVPIYSTLLTWQITFSV